MFARKQRPATDADAGPLQGNFLIAVDDGRHSSAEDQRALQAILPENARCTLRDSSAVKARELGSVQFVLALFADASTMDRLADAVQQAREAGAHTTLILAVQPSALAALGRWLSQRAESERLVGARLMVASSISEVIEQLPKRLIPVQECNVIRMPQSTEIENAPKSSFFTFSPQIQDLIRRIRAFADNGITRAYLLGGPGSGKTSLAYYYYLSRRKGRFVSVNLLAEDTGDKSAVKSLLCGHVPGAFPGAGARAGAFDIAQDGVCFLDESHGVMGAVMETLMEALDNGQYMPYGAAAKRPLKCALIFATNRSWEHLLSSVNIDEFTRLGAATLQVPELCEREEDLIAVAATTLARLAAPCTTWEPPTGVDPAAWHRIRSCRWHGNVRALIRTLEAAFVETTTGATSRSDLIDDVAIDRGIALWEPTEHHSHAIYASSVDSSP